MLGKWLQCIIRPHLEYASAIWDACDIALLENVQKFALRVCFREWRMGYFDLLDLSGLSSLSDRSLFKLCLLFKLVHNSFLAPLTLRGEHWFEHLLHLLSNCASPLLKRMLLCFLFSPRLLSYGNNLPSDVVQVDSFAVFKKCMCVFFVECIFY